ncbi:MAG: flagellin N-terminal helical domain-containing protein [Planctomycetota bacterium]|jgi:flagellin
MARINTNIPSLIAQSNLSRANNDLGVRLQRLSTGLRINRGADDPAGLIISERLRTEIEGVGQGIKNSERASNVIATTESSLSEVSDLLNTIKALVVESANTGAFSPDEVAANQKQIDSAIDSITRISNTSSFAGLKLLNGDRGYRLSGVNGSNLLISKINSANFLKRPNVQVDVEVVASAQQAQVFMRTDFSNAGVFGAGGTDGVLMSAITLEVKGPDGVEVISFASGTSVDSMVTAISNRSNSTGVNAERVNSADISSGLRFFSTVYGSESLISVRKISNSGTFFSGNAYILDGDVPVPSADVFADPNAIAATEDAGKDVVAVVNGALAVGRGLELTVRNTELDLELLLEEAFSQTISGTPETFYITGGGSLFQLGPEVNASQQVNIGVQSIAASRIGATLATLTDGSKEVQFLSSLKTGGANDLRKSVDRRDFTSTDDILDAAIDEIATLRGRLGAFERNTLQTNIRSLQSALENVTAAESSIRDADFARETSELTRAQVLTASTTSVLATANQQASSVLQLLG